MRTIAQIQWQARTEQWLDNVANSLLEHDFQAADNQNVLDALDEKYDLMKNRLIAEVSSNFPNQISNSNDIFNYATYCLGVNETSW